MSVFHLKPTYSNFKVSNEGLRKGGFHSYGTYQYS